MSRDRIQSLLDAHILKDGLERDILADYLSQSGIPFLTIKLPLSKLVANGSEVTASYIINQLNL